MLTIDPFSARRRTGRAARDMLKAPFRFTFCTRSHSSDGISRGSHLQGREDRRVVHDAKQPTEGRFGFGNCGSPQPLLPTHRYARRSFSPAHPDSRRRPRGRPVHSCRRCRHRYLRPPASTPKRRPIPWAAPVTMTPPRAGNRDTMIISFRRTMRWCGGRLVPPERLRFRGKLPPWPQRCSRNSSSACVRTCGPQLYPNTIVRVTASAFQLPLEAPRSPPQPQTNRFPDDREIAETRLTLGCDRAAEARMSARRTRVASGSSLGIDNGDTMRAFSRGHADVTIADVHEHGLRIALQRIAITATALECVAEHVEPDNIIRPGFGPRSSTPAPPSSSADPARPAIVATSSLHRA